MRYTKTLRSKTGQLHDTQGKLNLVKNSKDVHTGPKAIPPREGKYNQLNSEYEREVGEVKLIKKTLNKRRYMGEMS